MFGFLAESASPPKVVCSRFPPITLLALQISNVIHSTSTSAFALGAETRSAPRNPLVLTPQRIIAPDQSVMSPSYLFYFRPSETKTYKRTYLRGQIWGFRHYKAHRRKPRNRWVFQWFIWTYLNGGMVERAAKINYISICFCSTIFIRYPLVPNSGRRFERLINPLRYLVGFTESVAVKNRKKTVLHTIAELGTAKLIS